MTGTTSTSVVLRAKGNVDEKITIKACFLHLGIFTLTLNFPRLHCFHQIIFQNCNDKIHVLTIRQSPDIGSEGHFGYVLQSE